MRPLAIINKLTTAGFTVESVSGRLEIAPASRLTDQMLSLIREHRDGIMGCLQPSGRLAEFLYMVQESAASDYGHRIDTDLVLSVLHKEDIALMSGCPVLELETWATALALRLIREQGKIPAGWNQIVNCKGCGPVYMWPGAALECDGVELH